MQNKEPITDGTQLIFTEKSQGVLPAYNIRTDRWEVALDGIDKIQKSYRAKSEEKAKMNIVKDDNVSGAEPTQGTNTGVN